MECLVIDTNGVGVLNRVKIGFRNIKIWFLASATASNRLIYDANRLLGFKNVFFASVTVQIDCCLMQIDCTA